MSDVFEAEDSISERQNRAIMMTSLCRRRRTGEGEGVRNGGASTLNNAACDLELMFRLKTMI